MNSQRHGAAEVTQEDRDAAAEYFEIIGESISAINARLGSMDDLCTVQSYATHRQASQARLIAKLQSDEARERVARAICQTRYGEDIDDDVMISPNERRGCENLAEAALSSIVDILGEG